MKRLILIIMLVCVNAYAAESPFSINKENYFTAGYQDIKFQVSAKYNLLYPFDTGLYLAYTELAFWDIFDYSAPFREYNHNPEIFWMADESGNIFNSDLSIIDYIKISPYEHKSNGRDGDNSRGIDRCYVEARASAGTLYNAGITAKGWYYYHKASENRDIDNYTGHWEAELFLKVTDGGTLGKDLPLYKFYVKGGVGDSFEHGWVEAGGMFSIGTAHIQPRLMVSVFHGYCESLIDYNKKTTGIRAGLVFLY